MKIYAYLFVGLVWITLIGVGLILGSRKRLVIFGDRFDFLLSALVPVLALTLWVVERGGVWVSSFVITAVLMSVVIWMAHVENRRIWKTGLAVATKLSLVFTLTYLVLSVPYFLPRAFERSEDVFGRFADAYLGVMGAVMLGVVGEYAYRNTIKGSDSRVAINDRESLIQKREF